MLDRTVYTYSVEKDTEAKSAYDQGDLLMAYAEYDALVADQTTLEENPEWFDDEVKKVKESVGSDAAAWAVLDIELDEDAVMAALYPRHVVRAEITGSDR